MDDFRFCFKFPATIFSPCRAGVIATIWYRRFTGWPLETRIGHTGCSCPAAFGPRDLLPYGSLMRPATFTYGVEVRHPCF